jgi:hypothetical protein
MTRRDPTNRFGLERGKVFPASKTRHLFEPAGFALLDRHGVAWEYVARFAAT